MATMTLIAQAKPPRLPDSFGDNTVIISNVYSALNEPSNNGNAANWNQMFLSIKDFTTDTFPQFEDRIGFHSIKISKLALPGNVQLKYTDGTTYIDPTSGKKVYNYDNVNVGDVFTRAQLEKPVSLVLIAPRTVGFSNTGHFEYVNSVDGDYNSLSVSNFYVIAYSATLYPNNTKISFKPSVSINIPSNQRVKLTEQMFVDSFEHNDELRLEVGNIDPLIIAQATRLFNMYKNRPYKIEVISTNNSLKLSGKNIEVGQKIAMNDIKSGRLTVDSGNVGSIITFEFKFGNGYVGSFRLTAYN